MLNIQTWGGMFYVFLSWFLPTIPLQLISTNAFLVGKNTFPQQKLLPIDIVLMFFSQLWTHSSSSSNVCCSIWACITCSYVGITQPLFICSKSTKETPEQCQWCQLTLTRFHAFSSCFYCWLWTSKFLLGIDLNWIISPNNFVSTESPG